MGLDTLIENQFGHWEKDPGVAHTLSLYRRGVDIELIFPLWASFSDIQADFQNYHIWE